MAALKIESQASPIALDNSSIKVTPYIGDTQQRESAVGRAQWLFLPWSALNENASCSIRYVS